MGEGSGLKVASVGGLGGSLDRVNTTDEAG